MKLNKYAICLSLSINLLGCISIPKNVVEDAKESSKVPTSLPTKNVTGFSDALRCMDELILSHGIDQFSILAEDINDKTKKISTGTQDILIGAVSDMTKHSRVINLIALGDDSGNLISFLSEAGKMNVDNDIPIYDIRGSITQLDNNINNKQTDGGLGIQEFGFGAAVNSSASVLRLDLSIVNTSDLSVLAGVTSRNTIVIPRSGLGSDTHATIKTAGINFSLYINRHEGSAQALRNVIELATIELFGKLLKLPYWICLDADPTQDVVKNEINDWFYTMQANRELIPYIQNQLYIRGLYFNKKNGLITPEFEKAITLFRISQQMPINNKVDESVFSRLLNSPIPRNTKLKTQVKNPPTIPAEVAIENDQIDLPSPTPQNSAHKNTTNGKPSSTPEWCEHQDGKPY